MLSLHFRGKALLAISPERISAMQYAANRSTDKSIDRDRSHAIRRVGLTDRNVRSRRCTDDESQACVFFTSVHFPRYALPRFISVILYIYPRSVQTSVSPLSIFSRFMKEFVTSISYKCFFCLSLSLSLSSSVLLVGTSRNVYINV